MSYKQSVVRHIPDTSVVVLREQFLWLCDNNIPGALLLGIIEHWTNVKLGMNQQIEKRNTVAAKHGKEKIETDLWIYKTHEDFIKDSLGLLKDHEVRKGIACVVEDKKFVERRHNPEFPYDRTWQYKLNVQMLNLALKRIEEEMESSAPDQPRPASDTGPSVTGNEWSDTGERLKRHGSRISFVTGNESYRDRSLLKVNFREDESGKKPFNNFPKEEREPGKTPIVSSKPEKGNLREPDALSINVPPSPQTERVSQSASDALKGSADSSGGGSHQSVDTRYRHATPPKNVGGGHELADNRELRAPASQPRPNGKGGHFSADALSYNVPPSPYREPQQRNDAQDKFEFGQMMQGFTAWKASHDETDTRDVGARSNAAKKAGEGENSHFISVAPSGGAKIPSPASTVPLRANLCTFADLLPMPNEQNEEKCPKGGDQHCFDALSSHVAPIQPFGGESPIGVDAQSTPAVPSSRPPSDANLEALLERAGHVPFASDDIEIPENDPTGLTTRLERLNPYKSSKISVGDDLFDDDTPKAPVSPAETSLGEKDRPVRDALAKTVPSPKNKTPSQVHCTAQNGGGRGQNCGDTLNNAAPSAPVYTIPLSDAEAFVKEYGFKAFVNETGRLINARRLAT